MKHKISILMGIYNCENTLTEAIESIINQTYSNWELILCDDGSSDNTVEIVEKYCKHFPNKIFLLKNMGNKGLNFTLNSCLQYATGDYIARMDGDDISLPERFEKEVNILDNYSEYAIVSTPMIYFDESGDWKIGTAIEKPSKKDFIKGTPFCHAPCMVRAEALRKVNGYSINKWTVRAEDYDLWFRMYAVGYKGYNIQTPYYKMRDDINAYRRRKFRYCINEAYVRIKGYKMLQLPLKAYTYVLRPLIVGLLPRKIYLFLHHKKN